MQSSGKPEKARKYVRQRFGVEIDNISGLGFREVSGDVWLSSAQETGLEPETCGIRAVRFMDIGLKPTTYFLQLMGDRISGNVVEVDRKDFKALLSGEMIERKGVKDPEASVSDENSWNASGKGYVAVKFEGKVYGCGFYMDELVSSRIPEGRAKELLGTL